MALHNFQKAIWDVETLLKALQVPSYRRPEVRYVIVTQDFLQQVQIQDRKTASRDHQLFQAADQPWAAEAFDQGPLRTRHLQQPSAPLEPARAKVATIAHPHGPRVFQETDGSSIQLDWPAALFSVDRALMPDRMRNTEKLQRAVMREDGIGSGCCRYQKGIGLKALSGDTRRDHRVNSPGRDLQSAALEVVFESLHRPGAPTGRCQFPFGLVERKGRVRSKKVGGFYFMFHADTGSNMPYINTKCKVSLALTTYRIVYLKGILSPFCTHNVKYLRRFTASRRWPDDHRPRLLRHFDGS